MNLAKEAATWSKDPDCKVGACIASPDFRLFTLGYNGFAKAIEDSNSRLHNKSVKLQYTVRAEINAILNAHRSVAGHTMYCTKPPCIDCANAIIQADVVELHCPEPETESNWLDDNLFALDMLKEAGIRVFKEEL